MRGGEGRGGEERRERGRSNEERVSIIDYSCIWH